MTHASDPVYENFLRTLLAELACGPLNRPALVVMTAQGVPAVHAAVERALDDLIARGWARMEGQDMVLTDAGRAAC